MKLSFAPSSLHIRSDRRLFRRLLQNLVSNAIKYTTEGRILVGCRRQGQHVRIDVADTGSGIPEPMQRMVFREFERLSQSSRNTPGLGLGLSIVERISKALDHRVELQSIHGRGSRFSVIAPMAEPDTSQTEPAANNNENLAKPLSGMRILAIDNEPHILQGLNALLGGWNCVLATAPGMESALAAVTSEGFLPDAIIADYHLDEGDGIEAIDALRKAIGIEVPAVLITADHTPEVRQRAEQHEVKVLNKPVRPAALRSLLSQWRVMHRTAE